jgi:adenylosuccinate synthase
MPGDLQEVVRVRGQEFGVSTGRPRRCGWFDAVAAAYTVRLNGVKTIAVTLLDVLDEFDTIKVCTAYTDGMTEYDTLPADIATLERLKPVLKEFPGWKTSISQCRKFENLPENTRRYIEALEGLTKCEVSLISVGPGPEQTIVKPGAPLAAWLGDRLPMA